MLNELQMERFSELAAWCQNVDDLIKLFETNEQDVTKWRNRLAALSGTQIALGLVGGGLMIAGIVATGGLAAIPMAAGAIAIAATSAATGVAVGAARSVAEVGLKNARQEGGKKQGPVRVGGEELLKGSSAIGATQGLTRGLVAATEVGVATTAGAVAGGGGVVISLIKGGMGVHKAATINVGEIWRQIHWTEALQNVVTAEAFLDKHSSGFDGTLLARLKVKLAGTKANVSRIAQARWLDESRRRLKKS